MSEIFSVYDTILTTTAQHLSAAMRDTWTITVAVIVVGLFATVVLLANHAPSYLTGSVFGSTVWALGLGAWIHATFRRGLLQVLDRMNPDPAVQRLAVSQTSEPEPAPPGGLGGLLARIIPKH